MISRLVRIALLVAAGMSAISGVRAADFINVLTGGTSGIYYPMGVALSQVYGKAIPDAKTAVQATKASAENLKRVLRPGGTGAEAVEPDFSATPDLSRLTAFLETKTVWHPKGR